METVTTEVELPGLLYRIARRWDPLGLRLLDAGAICGAWLLAGLAGFDARADAAALRNLAWFVGLPLLTCLCVNGIVGLYGPMWRYASREEARRVLVAVVLGTLLSTAFVTAAAMWRDVGMSSIVVAPVAGIGALLGIGGVRFQSRFFALERQRSERRLAQPASRPRAVVVGATDAGAALAFELDHAPHASAPEIVGFVDDEARVCGRSIRGVPILGGTMDLSEICAAHRIDRILVALGDTPERKAVLARALATEAQVKVLPPASERVDRHLLRSLRDLDVTDLLSRPHAPVDSGEIGHYLRGATVLITGAGGSIGSEALRQVAAYEPGRLIALDREETLLHEVSLSVPEAEPVLVDITDEGRLTRVFREMRPDVVFHIAAQKHVPMLERHPLEAVRTNVIGTWNVATAAAEHGCGKLILISTDKAAEPRSVMGATKRVAEQIVFEVGRRHDREFVAVRFGNVLGTRGSVVPTFLRQILDGGPVTVTSPDMTRYFMTVQESVSLVLQAGAMAHPRSIFLLDMGQPVSILRLARQMIRLAGLRPGQDVPIEVVGLRPGERLQEQLHDEAEQVVRSAHPAISLLVPKVERPWLTLAQDIEDLAASVARCDDHAALKLVREVLIDRGVRSHVSMPASGTGTTVIDLRATDSCVQPQQRT